MLRSQIIATVLAAVLAGVSASSLVAQSSAGTPEWETLTRAPLPEGIEPILSVNGLTMPPQPVAEHSHAGPVVGYILQGEIENQVEPDPPGIYKRGSFFVEAPRQVHKMMRNLGPEPAKLIILSAGRTGVPASLIKVLEREPTKLVLPQFTQWQLPLPSTVNQELHLLRLTLPAGTRADARAHSGPGLVYVVEGTITSSAAGRNHAAGDLFLDPANRSGITFTNASSTEPATVLLYHVNEKSAPVAQTAPPAQLPYTAIHTPEFVTAREATFLQDDDILLGVVSGTVAKAFPAADLAQHGAVSDQLPDGPISVTWCGVCNTGAAFRADVKGRTLHFQFDRMVGGNEVQKDLETGTSWQQATGEAIDGPLKGTRLKLYPAIRTTWAEWRSQHPQTMVLKPLPGYVDRMSTTGRRIRDITRVGLEGAGRGALPLDGRLPPRETVAGLEVGSESVAFPFSGLRIARVVNERVGGLPVVVVHQPSSDTTTAFDARARGRALTFEPANPDASAVVDLETRSKWNAYGLALEGPMKGTQLKPLILVSQFWFAWSQFRPGTRVFTADSAKSAPARIVAWEVQEQFPVAENQEASLLRITLPPGARSEPHSQAGRGLVYVLQGSVESATATNEPRTFSAGETLFQPAFGPVLTFRNTSSSEPARLLLYHVGPKAK